MGFRQFTLTINRFTPGTLDHGVYTNGAPFTIAIICGLQQPTIDDLALLEEGKRTRKSLVIFSNVQLNLATQSNGADWMTIDGDTYEVSALKTFRTVFPFNFKSILTKIENPVDVPVAV